MVFRCSEREGDPRAWPEYTPVECDDFGMQAAYSYCTWVVEKDEQDIRTIAQWYPRAAPPPLPFLPSFVPRHEVALCAGDNRHESAFPEQKVSSVTEFEQGFLVGYNSGEWGGGLYWYTREGKLRQHVLNENLIRIVPVKDGFLAFTGLAHGFTNEGQASLLEFDGQSWNVAHSLDLAGAPKAFLDERDGSFLIVTSKRLVRVSDAKRVELLHRSKNGFWAPTSIARDPDGTLYLGARYVVVRLRPLAVGYSETWLAPPGATRPRPSDG